MASNLPTNIRKLLVLPLPLVCEIGDFRFANRIPSESEAIRQLLKAGLKASTESFTREVK